MAEVAHFELENLKGHFRTITHHKMLVMKLCFKCGLYKQGLLHDLSKYSPTEFLLGVRYYQGYRSPNVAEREERGFTEAWLHHKGRNKHHFEYWMDVIGHPKNVEAARSGELGDPIHLCGAPMPTCYVVEMFCDRVAACKVYQKDAYCDSSALDYYRRECGYRTSAIHPDSAAMLEVLLEYLAQYGEEAACKYIREVVVKQKFTFGEGGRFS